MSKSKLAAKPRHGSVIGKLPNGTEITISEEQQAYNDEIEQQLNDNVLGQAVILTDYTVATLPSASANSSGLIFVTNETGGPVPAFSDGTNWRRVTDRAIVS